MTSAVSISSSFRAFHDPVIFSDERVLRTLLKKEPRYVPLMNDNESCRRLDEKMRREVSDWMLEICAAEGSRPEIFCLAMNYLDRFVNICEIKNSQVQLLGATALLVACKVRDHQPLSAQRLVQYSDGNLTLVDIMEWEVLLLSKLEWDMSSVIASDFLEHLLHRLLPSAHAHLAEIRAHSETLITMCSATHICNMPSIIASASILVTLKSFLEPKEIDECIETIENVTLSSKDAVLEVMERVEQLMLADVDDASKTDDDNKEDKEDKEGDNKKEEKEKEEEEKKKEEDSTPTKLLDVAKKC